METTTLGGCGLRVSRLCLGTMIFGSQCDEARAVRIMDEAADLGIDFLDLADVYPVPPSPTTWGRTEEIVGRWLGGKRERFVVATKCAGRVGPGPNDLGGSRKHVIEACEASLRRLRTDRIDLFYLHHSDLGAPMEETLEALHDLVRSGKVLYLGVSNFEAWHLGLALAVIAERRLARLVAVQPRYNLLHRPYERDLIPLACAAGLGVVPYSALAGGMLTGKYRRGEAVAADSRFAQGDFGRLYRERYGAERMVDVAEAVVAVAEAEGLTPTQVALAWLLGREGVTAPIVGASRPGQLVESAGAVGRRLSPESGQRLDALSRRFA